MLSVQVQLRSHNSLNTLLSCIAVEGSWGDSMAVSCSLRLDKTSISGEDVGKTCLSQIHSTLCAFINTSSCCMLKKKVVLAVLRRIFYFSPYK